MLHHLQVPPPPESSRRLRQTAGESSSLGSPERDHRHEEERSAARFSVLEQNIDNLNLEENQSQTETETESEEIDSPEVEWLREDLLDGIDEDSDLCTSIHDLDSFMKSFEEEITTSPTSSHGSGAAEERIVESASDCGESGEVEEGIVELVSDSGESRPDLGYLLEASDDELGIPPPAVSPVRKELVTG
ncbi:hypothetical protein SASPL_133691 [Salvia splendens]|uniref:Uncharacterized protein n=1 Tax=Salvia splendens TaxID=180675 RepID=A0A8X8ZJC8_SALSN|nr:hypothetical protein SASPL_133691 [Salvia splendens]